MGAAPASAAAELDEALTSRSVPASLDWAKAGNERTKIPNGRTTPNSNNFMPIVLLVTVLFQTRGPQNRAPPIIRQRAVGFGYGDVAHQVATILLR